MKTRLDFCWAMIKFLLKTVKKQNCVRISFPLLILKVNAVDGQLQVNLINLGIQNLEDNENVMKRGRDLWQIK